MDRTCRGSVIGTYGRRKRYNAVNGNKSLNSLARRASIVAVALALLVGGCASPGTSSTPGASGSGANPSASQEVTHLKVALAAFQDVNSIWVGIEKGFYEEAGLEIEVVNTDWPGAQELLIGNHVEIGVSSDPDIVAANAQDQDLTLTFPLFFFAGAALMYDSSIYPDWQTFDEFLTQTDGDNLEAMKMTLQQVVGKKIGMQVPGGQYASLITMAKAVDIPFEDFEVVNLTQEDLPPALLSKSIDIMMGGIPQRLAAIREGYATLMDATAWPPSIDHAGFATRLSWAKDNPDVVKRFQEVIFRTQQYILDNPDDAFGIISAHLEEMGTTVSADDLKGVWNVMEFFVSSKADFERDVVSEDGRFYWKSRMEEVVNDYLSQNQIQDFNVPLEDMYYGLETVAMTEG